MDNFTSDFNTTTASLTTTTESEQGRTMHEVAKWINGFIIILGFITNSLVLVVLSRRRIGSQTTRIILMFLAATDLTVMFLELFVHYIPFYWRWFPIFFSDISCGIAYYFQCCFITISSWYIMLMTIERFTVVWFPMKAKIICTQRKILVSCLVIPIAIMIAYYFWITSFMAYEDDHGYTQCTPKTFIKETGKAVNFKMKIQIWIVIYFFVPAAVIVMLNIAIVFRLSKAQKIQKTLSSRRLSRKISRTNSSMSNSANSIKKATTMVIAASVTFVILMIPRGISTTVSLDANWEYSGDTEKILDLTAYLLQYLNHACNFFLYVLANNTFRKELALLFTCRSSRGKYIHRPLRSLDTDETQMTPRKHIDHHRDNTTGAVKKTLHYCLDTIKLTAVQADNPKTEAVHV